MSNKYLIIYHKEDNDGVFSAAIFYDYLVNDLHINIDLIDLLPADYNYLNNISHEYTAEKLYETYKIIIMTDISFNDISFMKSLYKVFNNNFIWCDHHKPIIDAANKTSLINIPGIRDINCSAILCVWRYLYDPFNTDYEKYPEILKILSAWDSWTYKEHNYSLDYVKNINIGINAQYQLNIDNIILYIKKLKNIYFNNKEENIPNIEVFYEFGKLINKYQDFTNKNIIENSGDCTWKIYTGEYLDENTPIWRTACALFTQGPTNSLMFKSLIHNDNADIMNGIVFKRISNGNWTISLYNIRDYEPEPELGGFHCGEFLKKFYNGGGHKGAAGCTITEDEFIKILKTKTLGLK